MPDSNASSLDPFTRVPRVAYFSMEIAIENDIPTYAGGLGILAGDVLRSAGDMNLPMIGVTLVSNGGYFRQEIDGEGRQRESAAAWSPDAHGAKRIDAAVVVRVEGRPVWVTGWLYILHSRLGGDEPVLLLDTDVDPNGQEDRCITRSLYGGDNIYRLKQEIVLGIGGVRLLRAAGFDIRHYHMNEGHSALLALELLRESAESATVVRQGESVYEPHKVRRATNFTTHTPIEAGHDRFSYDDVQRVLGGDFPLETIRQYGGADSLDMTRLAFNLSGFVNGVAKSHARISHEMYPEYDIRAITNGVHAFTWTSEPFVSLYDSLLPRWCCEPEVLVRADQIPDEQIARAHQQQKQKLVERVNALGFAFDMERPILGFARRMTAYKRPSLIFSDEARLIEIAGAFPLQLVFAGKAHPSDGDGKRLISEIHATIQRLRPSIPVAFIPDYDMDTSRLLVSGSDAWLNTPRPPLEASGTSGMKAALNGVPSLSILDGWWNEGCIEGVTGWGISSNGSDDGRDATALYDKLRQTVLPLYYGERSKWIAVMKGAISKNGSLFNSHRMLRRYASEVYG